MALDPVTNFGEAVVSGGHGSTSISIQLNPGEGVKLPSEGYNVTWWDTTSNGTVFNIDENLPVNKNICFDLQKYGNTHRTDKDGKTKYHLVDNAGIWELHERDNWVEFIDERLF